MELLAVIPANRFNYGTIVLGTLALRCLARSDQSAADSVGNPTRDPLKQMGDLPYGTYTLTLGGVETPRRSYGPTPVIHLTPTGGDALTAAQNGRAGLLIHGGDYADDGHSLRPTHGCMRLADRDMAWLVTGINWDETVELTVQPPAATDKAA